MQKTDALSQVGHVPSSGKKNSTSLEIVNTVGKSYRKLTDWIKPTIDKVIDPMALFIGANAVLSLMIYLVHQEIIIPILFGIGGGKLLNFIDRYAWLEFIIKFMMYSSIYGFTNLAVILPVAARFFERTSVPSWKNHLKTWAILSIGTLAWTGGGVQQDYHQIKWRIKRAEGFFSSMGAIFGSDNMRTIDRYLSGVKCTKMTNHMGAIFGFDASKSIVNEIARESRRIRQRHISTTAKIVKDATPLIQKGLIDNPAQLIYITRVIYFEGAFDPKAKSLADIKAGLTGITSVIYNRYLYDSANEQAGRPREFSTNGANLYDVVFFCRPNTFGSITWQFSAIPDNASYFNGKRPLSLLDGDINVDRVLLCYDILIDVLAGKRRDNTKAALFYQNPSCVDRHNRNWKKHGLDDVKKINSHVFYRPQRLSENWRDRIGV